MTRASNTPDAPVDGFLARWARRKAQVREGKSVSLESPRVETATPVDTSPSGAPRTIDGPLGGGVAAPAATPEVDQPVRLHTAAEAPLGEAPPTLADVALLTRDSDYSRFVGAGVDNGVKQAAMKKLFSDPHFNVMDGLDTYIDDYGKPDPIPLSMLRQMNQSKFLRLFEDDEEDAAPKTTEQTAEKTAEKTAESTAEPAAEPGAEPPALNPNPSDDHADLRLQQDPAARQPGLDQSAGA